MLVESCFGRAGRARPGGQSRARGDGARGDAVERASRVHSARAPLQCTPRAELQAVRVSAPDGSCWRCRGR